MSQRTVTLSEREQIYLKKMAGQTLAQIAQTLGLSEACVRKWWRCGRDEGLLRLVGRKRGRPAQGIPAQFSTQVRQTCVQPKREDKRWEANRVLLEMQEDPTLVGLSLPSRSRLYPYFRQECPDCLNVWTKHIQVPVPIPATSNSSHRRA